MKYSFLQLVQLLLLATSVATTAAVGSDPISMQSCLEAGFDPTQLACSTCQLLPETVIRETCQSCCLSYKTLEKRTQRYQAAILVHSTSMPSSYFQEVSDMIREDWQDLIDQKGIQRLRLKDTPDRPRPSTILWFHKMPSSALSLQELFTKADDRMVLDGWKRDDIREMFKAILPDKD